MSPARVARLCGHAFAHLACLHADRLPPGDPAPRTCGAPDHIRAACRFRPVRPQKEKR